MSKNGHKALGPVVEVYDTTLRDGTQMEGMSLSCDDKLRIAEHLDSVGVTFIEGGWPGSNPKDVEFFERAKDLQWKNVTIAAFGMMLGMAQATAGSSAWGFWALPVGLVLLAIMYGVSQVGRRLAAEQTQQLRALVEEALETPIS